MLLRDSSSVSVSQSTSPTRSSAYTGCAFLPQRISFKLAVLTCRAIHGTAPTYLQSCFTRLADMSSRQRLRSSASQRLAVPPVRLTTVGRRAFPVSGANLWNSLPPHASHLHRLSRSSGSLKTFLFTKSYPDIHI